MDCPNEKIVLVVAMPKEARELLPLFEDTPRHAATPLGFDVWRGLLTTDRELILLVSGIGKVSASLATAEAIRLFDPTLILNVGVSGTLHKAVEVGDIIVADRLCYHDVYCGEELPRGQVQGYPMYYSVDKERLVRLQQGEVPFLSGLVACGDRFMSESAEHAFIKHYFPEALALDMESAAIAQTAFVYHKQLLVIRLISDTPDRADGYAQYLQFWQECDRRKSFFGKVHRLIRLL